MQSTRFARKVTCPALPSALLHRSSLLKQLQHFCLERAQTYQLGLICAPVGYGKTTVLADFAQQTSLPCCWCVFDQTDQDQHNFLQLLVASIRQCFPAFGKQLDELITDTSRTGAYHDANTPNLETVIDILAEHLESEITERFLLIFCNYHEVNGARAINVLVNRLIKALPPVCLLLIESRSVPEIEFAALLARRQIFGLSSQDFRFAVQEIQELARLQEIDALSEAEIEQLILSFDGWIAGILLGTRLGDVGFLRAPEHPHPKKRQQALSIDQQILFSYLVHEVFGREPELFAFLKEAAILQQMTPALCATLLNNPQADELLRQLEHKGFFVSHSGEQEHLTYVCHPILRDILRQELYRANQEHFYELHRRAAALLYAAHDFEAAVWHAIEARAVEMATAFIVEQHERLVAQGYAETVARWIDALPKEALFTNPRLLLMRASIFTILGDQFQAFSLLEAASTLLASPRDEIDGEQRDTLLAALALVRSRAFFQAGDYLNVQEVCQRIIATVPADEFAIHAEVQTLLGSAPTFRGILPRASRTYSTHSICTDARK